MNSRVLATSACLALILGAGTLQLASSEARTQPEPSTKVIELTIRHSRFVPASLVIPNGTNATFVIRNTDPIDHELIIGDQSVQSAHEKGTDAVHGSVRGEVSVAAGARAVTTYSFARQADNPEQVMMGCHLPGHWDYGMRGTITTT